MTKRRKLQRVGIGLLVLFLGAVSMICWGMKKQVWFCDEIYTYESANGFEQDWPAAYVDEWMTGKDVEAFFAADSDRLSLNEITVRLYSDHVPLYFWLFRIVSFLAFRGSGTIWIGLSINLFFYLFVTGLVYFLFLALTDKPVLSGGVTVLTCIVNRLMIEQATTLRMYMMLLWVELILLLAGFLVLRGAKTWNRPKGKIGKNDGKDMVDRKGLPIRAFLLLFLVSVTGFLTHYDFWIFYAVTAAFFCLLLLFSAIGKNGRGFWRTGEFRCVIVWVVNFVVSLLVTIGLFPYCRWNLNRGKGEIALKSMFVFSSEKVQNILWGYKRLVASIFGEGLPPGIGLGILFGCILGGMFVLYRRRESDRLRGLVLTCLIAQAYQFVVCFTMPDVEEERYLWGAFTVMMLCMAWGGILLVQMLFSRIREEKVRGVGQWVVGAVCALCILAGELLVIDGGNGVAYLFYPGKDVRVLREYSKIPWLVYGPTVGVYSYYDWLIPEQICFLSQENTPEDADAVKVLAERECFLLYVYEDYYPRAVEFLERELGSKLEGRYLMQSTNLAVYLVEAAEAFS